MSIIGRIVLIFTVLGVFVGCDQITKSMAKKELPVNFSLSYLGDTVRLRLVYNQGAFLGMGSHLSGTMRKVIFTFGAGVLMLGVLAYAFITKPGQPPVIFSIALLFSGGVGNLIDRIVYNGFVVDFINVGIGPVRTGIFNVADMAVTFGAILLFLISFQSQRKKV